MSATPLYNEFKSVNNFSLLLEELNTLHFAAFGYQSGELFQRLNPFFQGTENFVECRVYLSQP